MNKEGAVPNYKYVRNKLESEFPTGQAEYSQSCERMGSCLVTEGSMMKSSMLFPPLRGTQGIINSLDQIGGPGLAIVVALQSFHCLAATTH